MTKKHPIIYGLLSVLTILTLITNSAFATSGEMLDYLSTIDSFYWNPDGNNRGGGCFGSIGSNLNYAGAKVFSDAEMERINTFMPYYQDAASKYGFPWQILAVLHSVESSLASKNPAADSDGYGEGIFQMYSYRIEYQDLFAPGKNLLDSDGTPNSDFIQQVELAAERVANNYGSGLNLDTPNGIKKMFFNYNGANSRYKQKAKDLGFSDDEAENGEGSPYVMNRYDAQRDPTNKAQMNTNWPGMYVGNGVWNPTYEWTGFGAYVKFEALGGDVGAGSCGELISGGMDYEAAYNFVKNYVDNPEECSEWSSICHIYGKASEGKIGEPGANCVTFSQYFLNKYTTLGLISPMGNGGDVVSNLINNYGLADGGNIPRPYAIFSTRSPKWSSAWCDKAETIRCGHTGVVLGIDESAGKIYIGQMAYGSLKSWGLTRIEYDLSDYSNGDFTYAYTDEFLKI